MTAARHSSKKIYAAQGVTGVDPLNIRSKFAKFMLQKSP